MTTRTLWIEEYSHCGCSVGPFPKRDLPGYCATHGNGWKNRYPVSGKGLKVMQSAAPQPDGEKE
jgi:hypothetical protein